MTLLNAPYRFDLIKASLAWISMAIFAGRWNLRPVNTSGPSFGQSFVRGMISIELGLIAIALAMIGAALIEKKW